MSNYIQDDNFLYYCSNKNVIINNSGYRLDTTSGYILGLSNLRERLDHSFDNISDFLGWIKGTELYFDLEERYPEYFI